MADQLIRATAAADGIRAVGVITTQLTEEARQRHQLSYVGTAALGRSMAAGLLLASSMKQPQARVNLRIEGDGPLGSIMVDAGCNGTVRGYVQNPQIELPPTPQGKLDVGGAVGNQGFLYVIRDIGYGYPYSSTVELVSGEIAEDVTYYLATSEQTASALLLGVFVGEAGVTAAGGLMVQILPKSAEDETLISTLEERVAALQSFTPLIQQGRTLPDIFGELLADMGMEILPQNQLLRFHCGCSQERMLGALKILGCEELKDILATDAKAEATCQFCNQVYWADAAALSELIAEF
ncbi:Hsp33 family molecular chaperone HslO [Candidatus Synechococcus calcipolaris G9]|uniref:33 kDa chaperonin n=1 Tax=Candidatus Synechococcus calcipolaris G9 TaxID=1497997 RepID=A0ABT6EU16_9SYNE|nr:Hsp33 family molecular chaperone HslO [Candidatus Synechococcus calcipolaris]MDG2989395.1 Hsp33 family molecular chaperone HslO [Candidatus Synechococcus calcipolaris G9]